MNNFEEQFFSQKNKEYKEISKGERLVEVSKNVGILYPALIQRVIGEQELDPKLLDVLPDDIKDDMEKNIESIDSHLRMQSSQLAEKKWGAKELLLQGRENDESLKLLLNDRAKYSIEEVSKGIFIIFMDDDLYSKLHGENVAVASILENGSSYISMPNFYKDDKKFQSVYRENLSHEVSHIVWSFLLKDKKINILEGDPDIKMAFRFFQDEAIAKLCSGGGPMGYSHLLLMDEKSLEQFRKQNPKKEEQINKTVVSLNTFMYDEVIPLMEKVGIKRKDLIFSIMNARNFDELRENLKRYKLALEEIEPIIDNNEKKSNGWDMV